MKRTTVAMLDDVSEQLEQTNNTALAAVLDTVTEELLSREANVVTASTDAAAVLKRSAPTLFGAVEKYGAKSYRVDSDKVEMTIARGEHETVAEFRFCSQDEVGQPQLRITFECDGERMVRWASLDQLDGSALVAATQHVFGTGENYGRNVVTAKSKTAEAANGPGFYAAEGVEHVWPEVPGWDYEMENPDRFGDATKVSYQKEDREPYIYVTFDGGDIALGKGRGTWSYELAGKKSSGTFGSEDEVPKLLAKLAKQINKEFDALLKKAVKQLQSGGWKNAENLDGSLQMDYDFDADYHVGIESYDSADIAMGKGGEVSAALVDSGGLRNETLLEETATVRDIAGMLKFADRFVEKARRHLESKGLVTQGGTDE